MTRHFFRPLGGALLILALAGLALIWFVRKIEVAVDPPPETVVAASLQGLREQNRLSAFLANYVAVVTSTQTRFGLSAKKTMILPGLVRYEVDLAKLSERDVTWDRPKRELRVTLPALEVVGPQIDLTQIREYDGGGMLMRLTDAEARLDAANRRAGQAELLRQARQPVPMNLAKDATRRAIQRSFALPLAAVGQPAMVRVRFADEPDFPAVAPVEQIDRSRSLKEVYEAPLR